MFNVYSTFPWSPWERRLQTLCVTLVKCQDPGLLFMCSAIYNQFSNFNPGIGLKCFVLPNQAY